MPLLVVDTAYDRMEGPLRGLAFQASGLGLLRLLCSDLRVCVRWFSGQSDLAVGHPLRKTLVSYLRDGVGLDDFLL